MSPVDEVHNALHWAKVAAKNAENEVDIALFKLRTIEAHNRRMKRAIDEALDDLDHGGSLLNHVSALRRASNNQAVAK